MSKLETVPNKHFFGNNCKKMGKYTTFAVIWTAAILPLFGDLLWQDNGETGVYKKCVTKLNNISK